MRRGYPLPSFALIVTSAVFRKLTRTVFFPAYMDPQHTSKKDRKRKDRSTDVSGNDGRSIEDIESRKKRRKAKKREKDIVIGSAPRFDRF
jgi:hypothetical protein